MVVAAIVVAAVENAQGGLAAADIQQSANFAAAVAEALGPPAAPAADPALLLIDDEDYWPAVAAGDGTGGGHVGGDEPQFVRNARAILQSPAICAELIQGCVACDGELLPTADGRAAAVSEAAARRRALEEAEFGAGAVAELEAAMASGDSAALAAIVQRINGAVGTDHPGGVGAGAAVSAGGGGSIGGAPHPPPPDLLCFEYGLESPGAAVMVGGAGGDSTASLLDDLLGEEWSKAEAVSPRIPAAGSVGSSGSPMASSTAGSWVLLTPPAAAARAAEAATTARQPQQQQPAPPAPHAILDDFFSAWTVVPADTLTPRPDTVGNWLVQGGQPIGFSAGPGMGGRVDGGGPAMGGGHGISGGIAAALRPIDARVFGGGSGGGAPMDGPAVAPSQQQHGGRPGAQRTAGQQNAFNNLKWS